MLEWRPREGTNLGQEEKSVNVPGAGSPSRPSPVQLLAAIGEIGLTSLGGWASYYHDAFVLKRRWLTDQDYLEGSAISNIIPGPVFVNITVFAAYRLGGWLMVPLGLLLVLVPGALAMVVLSDWYSSGGAAAPVVAAGLAGLSAGAAGLTVVTPLRLLQSMRPHWRTLLLAGSAFLALGPLNVSMVLVVPVVTLLGLWLERPHRAGKR
jgi:chromate transporter